MLKKIKILSIAALNVKIANTIVIEIVNELLFWSLVDGTYLIVCGDELLAFMFILYNLILLYW